MCITMATVVIISSSIMCIMKCITTATLGAHDCQVRIVLEYGGQRSQEGICIYIYIYIYLEREGERERERETYVYVHIYTWIYTYIYIYTHVFISLSLCVYIYIYIYVDASANITDTYRRGQEHNTVYPPRACLRSSSPAEADSPQSRTAFPTPLPAIPPAITADTCHTQIAFHAHVGSNRQVS